MCSVLLVSSGAYLWFEVAIPLQCVMMYSEQGPECTASFMSMQLDTLPLAPT